MSRGVRVFRPARSLSIVVGLILAVATIASSCQTVGDWWKGDFHVAIEGAPDDVASVYFILGSSKDLEADIEPDKIGELVKQAQAENYWEIAEFHPDRDKRRWERGHHRSRAADVGYYSTTLIKDEYLALISVHRSEFREHPETAIAVVVHQTDGAWHRSVITESDFHSKKEAWIKVLPGAIEMHVSTSRRDVDTDRGTELDAD